MNTHNSKNSSAVNMEEVVARFYGNHIIATMAVRYSDLASLVFSRRAYRIESEMAAIASEVQNHARIPQGLIEGFLVALAKSARPGPEALSLPECEELEIRSVEQRFLNRIEKPVKVAVMADWSPSRNVEVSL